MAQNEIAYVEEDEMTDKYKLAINGDEKERERKMYNTKGLKAQVDDEKMDERIKDTRAGKRGSTKR